jgi:hypothetical protein
MVSRQEHHHHQTSWHVCTTPAICAPYKSWCMIVSLASHQHIRCLCCAWHNKTKSLDLPTSALTRFSLTSKLNSSWDCTWAHACVMSFDLIFIRIIWNPMKAKLYMLSMHLWLEDLMCKICMWIFDSFCRIPCDETLITEIMMAKSYYLPMIYSILEFSLAGYVKGTKWFLYNRFFLINVYWFLKNKDRNYTVVLALEMFAQGIMYIFVLP